ncbi:MAG: hypothetical protein KDD50_15785, partial [Bdellovibrionales bacterium]|nr:hypothetical protein [Bdellovibrionales bacterium]
ASELKNLDSTHVFPLLYGPENSHSYFDLTQARREVSRLPLAVLSNKFKGSLFLIGDSDFLTDEYIESYGNKQLISQVLRRLLGEDDFSMIEDKFPEMAVLKMTREMKFFILILSFLFPFLFLLLAFIIWYINSNRRRDNENHRNSIPNEN